MTCIIEIEPVCVELGSTKVKGKVELTLRRFQEETIGFFHSPRQYFFLSAPTGSGKTLTLLAPLLSNILYGTSYDGALGVYPTKPLTVDQFESLKATLGKLSKGEPRELGSGVIVYDVEFDVEKDGMDAGSFKGRVGLVLLIRNNIEKLKEILVAESGRQVLDVIRRDLLTERVDYLITLAVPEYPYLMFSHMYRSHHDLAKLLDLASSGSLVYKLAEKLLSVMSDEDELRKRVEKVNRVVRTLVDGRVAERELADLTSAILPPVLFFDEFHTWGFYELPTAISLILLHRLISATSTKKDMYKVVFSSATPNTYVMDILEKLAGRNAVLEVRADAVDCNKSSTVKIRGKTTVEFYAVGTRLPSYLSWIEVDGNLPEVIADKSIEIQQYRRAIVFGRRVYTVEEAAKTFYEKTRATPTVVTGFTPPPGFFGKEELVKKRQSGELYVFGNYAVELGVDLQNIPYSIISASSLGELLQRMGRSGRGGIDSKLVILVPVNYVASLVGKLGGKSRVSYSEFINALSWVMVEEPVVKKLGNRLIAKSRIGCLRIYLPLSTFVLVSVLRYRDKPRDLEPMLSEFKKTLSVAGVDAKFFSWLSRRVSKHPRVLVELASFRLSPSVPYIREGSSNQVDGESNPITMLSNYEVELDTTGGFKLVLKESRKVEIKRTASIHISHPKIDMLESLDRAILPGSLLLELIEPMKPSRSILTEVIRRLDTPIYVVYTGGESITSLNVLHAYGQAIVLECSEVVYVYLLVL